MRTGTGEGGGGGQVDFKVTRWAATIRGIIFKTIRRCKSLEQCTGLVRIQMKEMRLIKYVSTRLRLCWRRRGRMKPITSLTIAIVPSLELPAPKSLVIHS